QTGAVALACALAGGAVNLLTQPRTDQGNNKPADDKKDPTQGKPPAVVQTPKAKPWCPGAEGWRPRHTNGIGPGSPPLGEGELYGRLARGEGKEQIVAILVPRKRASDPPSFYMLESKITNRVFKKVWDEGMAEPLSDLKRFQAEHKSEAPEKWK